MYSMVPIVSNTVLYMKVAKRINLKISYQKKKICNYVWLWILSRLIMVAIS